MPTRPSTDIPPHGGALQRRACVARAAALAVPLAALVAGALVLGGCERAAEPVRDSREALGTVVTVTAYAEDDADAQTAIGDAYEAMAAVERSLDAHDPSSEVARFNTDPYTPQPLPEDAREVLEAVDRLAVNPQFSPSLLGVLRLYDFEGGGRVPDPQELAVQVGLASTFGPASALPDGSATPAATWAFARPKMHPQPASPGLDFGGAAKGLALDRAEARLEAQGVDAALLSAGSTTIAYGAKPDGEPWRVGVENPRDPEALVATINASKGIVVSTSGDYQRFFERDGRRYHHILDPATGLPATGFRSLTVFASRESGALSALDSDILSTALFVGGPQFAEDYARERGLGLIVVDAAGEVLVIDPPVGSGIAVELAEE